MSERKQPKTCDRCGYVLIFTADTWERMEWANGKMYPTKHRGCGGEFVSKVSEIRRAS